MNRMSVSLFVRSSNRLIIGIFLAAILLSVLFSLPVTSLEPPMIVSWSSDTTVEMNEPLSLTCSAEPAPVASQTENGDSPDEPIGDGPQSGENVRILYSWYRCQDNSGTDMGTELSAPSEIGQILSVDTSIPGTYYYYCAVYALDDAESQMARTPVITVNVIGEIDVVAPKIITPLKDAYEIPKDAELVLSLHCEEQLPGVTTVWEWYRKSDTDGNHYERIATSTNGLFGVPTEVVGEFTYFCRITASAGSVSKTTQSSFATVNVIGHEHEFGDWFTTSYPTCLLEGSRERTCSCGYVETEILPPLEHQFGEWTLIREGVGDHPAQEGRTCTMCGMTETRDYIPPQTEPPEDTTSVMETTGPEDTTDAQITEPPVTTPQETTAISGWSTVAPTTTAPKPKEPSQDKTKTPFPAYWLIILFGMICTILGTWGSLHFLRKSSRQKKEEKRAAKAKMQATHRQHPQNAPMQNPGNPEQIHSGYPGHQNTVMRR